MTTRMRRNTDGCTRAEVAAPTVAPATDVAASPALSQVGKSWPTDGRQVGVVVGADTDAGQLAELMAGLDAANMVPLVIAARGGEVAPGIVAHRTWLTARSIEFDAVVVASAASPGDDAHQGLDAKAAAPGPEGIDPRVSLLLHEVWRQAKPIGAWGAGGDVLAALHLADSTGVENCDSAQEVLAALEPLIEQHRVWERFPATGRLA